MPTFKVTGFYSATAPKFASLFAIGCIGFCGIAPIAMAEDAHTMITPSDIKWGPASKALPAGAEAVVLFGDPTKEGPFALRLKLPAGYAIPPHTHPGIEVDTVISGTVILGMGEKADRSAAKAVPAGSFFALPPGMAHFAYFDEETVLQLTTKGPWGVKYINPADDPRKTQ
jgi:quercetin dioxygenase-like cupin family protein